MAAAIGAGLPVHEPTGNMVVDIGGGTTEVAVISLGGIVTAQSIRVGGDELDNAIIQYVKKEYSLMLGERTAEEIKMAIGSAFPIPDEPHAEIRGRDLVSGLPKTIVVSSEEIRKALEEPVNADRRRGQVHPRQVPARAVRRHHGPRHRAHRRWRPAQGPRRAAAPRDRHADPHHRRPAGLGRASGPASASRSSRPCSRCSSPSRGTDAVRGADAASGDADEGQPAHPRRPRAALLLASFTLITLDLRGGQRPAVRG